MALIDYLLDPIVFGRMNVQKLLILLFQIPNQGLYLQIRHNMLVGRTGGLNLELLKCKKDPPSPELYQGF